MAEGLLTKADRASMSSALELRAPFLDEAVMAFAATLPVAERVQSFTTKVFLKRYALRYLPKIHRAPPQTRFVRADRPLAARPAARLGRGRAGQRTTGQLGIRNAGGSGIVVRTLPAARPIMRGRIWTLIVLERMAGLVRPGNRRYRREGLRMPPAHTTGVAVPDYGTK